MTNHDETATSSAETTSAQPTRWLDDVREAALALRELAQAQWDLLRTELRVARWAALVLLVAMMFGTACAVGLGLSLLALLGIALSLWFGSWIWSLVGLAVLMLLGVGSTLLIALRCIHWLTLPGTRAQLRSMAHHAPTTGVVSQAPNDDNGEGD